MPRRNLTGELTRYLDKRARLSTVPTETGVIRSTGSTGGGTWVTPAMVPIASTANPQNVGSSAAPGSSSGFAHGDHVHQGIHSLAVSGSTNLFGDVTLSASGGATLAQSTANVITLTAPAASTATPAAVSDTGVVGTSTAWAAGDHAHALNIGTGLAFSSSTLAVQLANNAYLPGLTSTGATRNLVGISTADAALIGSTGLPSRLQGTSLAAVPGIAVNLLPDSTSPTRDIGASGTRWNAIYGSSLDVSGAATVGTTLTVNGTGTHTIAGNLNVDSGALYVSATGNGIVVNGTSLTAGYVAQINGAALFSSASATSLIAKLEKTSATAFTTNYDPILTLHSSAAANDGVLMRWESSGIHNTLGIKKGTSYMVLTMNVTGTAVESLTFDYPGNVVVGQAALATTATDGFLYIPTCAGTPTGVPTAYTGRVPIIFDTTNNKIYVYDGGWLATAALT